MNILKKNKFWIVIGGAIVVMISVYFIFANRYRIENSKQIMAIDNLLAQLNIYERKGSKTINKKWIETEKTKLEKIKEDQLLQIELLKERDHHIEKFFGADQEVDIKDVALWKNRYIRKANLLFNNLAERNILVNEGALPFKEWGGEIPAWDEIVVEQKKFWIAEELINIIQKEDLNISNIEGIKFRQDGFSSGIADSELYDTIPFTVKISIDIENILFLINELTKSKICFEIESVNIIGKLGKSRLLELSEKTVPILHDTVVNVIIKAYAVDFKT